MGYSQRCGVVVMIQLARQNTTRRVQGEYQYVIIGAGTTAYAAIETIFNHQPDADILIISSEGVSWIDHQTEVLPLLSLTALFHPLLHHYHHLVVTSIHCRPYRNQMFSAITHSPPHSLTLITSGGVISPLSSSQSLTHTGRVSLLCAGTQQPWLHCY